MPNRVSDRDQSTARDSFMDFSELVRRFPDSRYVPDARQRMVFLRNNLAAYEIAVAEYYMRRESLHRRGQPGPLCTGNLPQHTAELRSADRIAQSLYGTGTAGSCPGLNGRAGTQLPGQLLRAGEKEESAAGLSDSGHSTDRQTSGQLAVSPSGRNRIAPVTTERPVRDPHTRRCLPAFVFVQQHQARNPAHHRLVETILNDSCDRPVRST